MRIFEKIVDNYKVDPGKLDSLVLRKGLFVYEDKPNYETIMIESIEGNPDYAEIGVFQDDVCIGARVNEAYPIQILAYSTPVEEGGGPLIFMLYSESKGPVSVSPATFHPGNNIANEQTIEPERYGFRVLTLKTNDQQMPSALALHSRSSSASR